MAMTKNPQFHQRSKHINIRYHWIRKYVEDKIFEIHSIRDPQQTANILTKPIPKPKHDRHRAEMGI
jgi:hypothetical protein